ncbi:MAG TPA: M12 family metallo-peptidase [Pyrinomonadaceae bacterium]|nr:M12 family metallo-peptidase [Pyrinomonadaceae bacterium]
MRNKIIFSRPKFYVPFLLALAVLAILAAPGFYSPSGAQSKRVRFEQDVEQVFTNHEDVRLDSQTAAQRVRESGRLSVQTPARDFEIVLAPNDLRAPNYRAEEVSDGGIVREVPMSRVNTYKGSVVGMPDADARFTVDDDTVEGMIITSDQSYFLESARKYSTSADAGDYLFYKASDVRPEITRTCGDTLDEQVNREAKQFASEFSSHVAPQVFSPFKVAEIATEADFEYVSAFGGSSANANSDILSVMNQVQAIYERDIGLTFTVVSQHTWTTADPYSTSGASQPAVNLLNSFTNYWNANFAATSRDDVHLWTGKNLGGPAGIAWMGEVCLDGTHSYGLSDLENMAPFRVGIPAHEIGHNFNASHCDGQAGCDNSIMLATQTPSNNLTFCPFSVSEITNWVNLHSSCLGQATAPSTIQFSSASYTINEGDPAGRVNITLTRTGNTTSSASVNFATNDAAGLTNCNVLNGTASPRCDYENTIGTATWAAGDASSKTFSIAIVDDSYAEGSETFTVGLNSPSGATLGAQSSATVTITDNEATNGPNPIDGTNFFVRQQYIDFLGREPDPGGFAGWTSTIKNCSGDTTQCDRIHVSQLFFQSAEFQDRGYFVYRFYPVAFGRKPDYAEFVPDLASVSGFLDANQLEAAKVAFIAGFMARPAFAGTYNSLNNTQYVDALLNTAGVTLSSRQSMIDGLNNSTTTRGAVLRQIVESPEVSTKYNHQAYAVMEYFGYLRRQPDAFYPAWIQVLDQSNDPRGMVTGFVTSQEYRSRFGP